MRRIAYLLCASAVLFVTSCGLMAGAAGVEKGEDGKVHINTNSPMDMAQHSLEVLGPWGIIAAAGIAVVKKTIRHREILAAGQKDDDNNGIPDEDEKPKA